MAEVDVTALGHTGARSAPWRSEQLLTGVWPEPLPRLRGWLHAVATPVVLTASVLLVAAAPDTAARVGAALFTGCALTNFAVSTAMHLGHWQPRQALLIRRVDHACIFTSIAGSYTPFALLMLSGWRSALLLTVSWVGAGLGAVFRLTWEAAPRALCVVIYLALGWAGLVFVPEFARFTPSVVPVLLGTGVVLYTAGGLVYALRRPNPVPGWLGFHEVFHALSIAGFATHYAALLIAVSSQR
jgi:hemolysin III